MTPEKRLFHKIKALEERYEMYTAGLIDWPALHESFRREIEELKKQLQQMKGKR